MKIALIGYGKMGKEIENIAIERSAWEYAAKVYSQLKKEGFDLEP